MIPIRLEAAPNLPCCAPHRVVFNIFRNDGGRWCASAADGMTAGTFFDRDAAIRFARRESTGSAVLVLHFAPELPQASRRVLERREIRL